MFLAWFFLNQCLTMFVFFCYCIPWKCDKFKMCACIVSNKHFWISLSLLLTFSKHNIMEDPKNEKDSISWNCCKQCCSCSRKEENTGTKYSLRKAFQDTPAPCSPANTDYILWQSVNHQFIFLSGNNKCCRADLLKLPQHAGGKMTKILLFEDQRVSKGLFSNWTLINEHDVGTCFVVMYTLSLP